MTRTAEAVRTSTEVSAPAEVHELADIRSVRHAELVARARDELVCGDEQAALDICISALRYGRSYEGLALAGTLHAVLGNPEESIRFTREAIEAAPGRPDAYYDLAATLLDVGRAEEALHWIEAGVKLLGRRHDDLVDFIYAAWVETLTALGRLEEAERVLVQARRRTDDPLDLIDGVEDLLVESRHRPTLRVIDGMMH